MKKAFTREELLRKAIAQTKSPSFVIIPTQKEIKAFLKKCLVRKIKARGSLRLSKKEKLLAEIIRMIVPPEIYREAIGELRPYSLKWVNHPTKGHRVIKVLQSDKQKISVENRGTKEVRHGKKVKSIPLSSERFLPRIDLCAHFPDQSAEISKLSIRSSDRSSEQDHRKTPRMKAKVLLSHSSSHSAISSRKSSIINSNRGNNACAAKTGRKEKDN